ncbi:MAG: nucleotide exchange factor GrpE [Bacteroidales bacterium]|nr:nucleotide exchange factor GrpE [Bacteroidales bacterium]
MTGTEKNEEIKHEDHPRKKHEAKHVDKHKSETDPHEKQKLADELKASEEKVKELQDKYLRLSAEFDNYRKRTLKEKADMVKTASEDLLIKFIPFVDDVERGISALNTSQDLDALKEGMNLIYTRLRDFLQQNGVKEIEAMNLEFNTDVHEAVTKIPATEEELKGKVVDVIQKGYYLHDKVIRYPKVVIGE